MNQITMAFLSASLATVNPRSEITSRTSGCWVLELNRQDKGTALDCKPQSASETYGHSTNMIATQRVWGGIEPGEMARIRIISSPSQEYRLNVTRGFHIDGRLPRGARFPVTGLPSSSSSCGACAWRQTSVQACDAVLEGARER